MGEIIGITGAIGSGKTTVAHLLCNQEPSHAHYESGEVIAEVADDFNRALSGELAFETTSDDIELTNQALIWFVESISEKLHTETTWNQLAITKKLLAAQPELFEKLFEYLRIAKADPRILDARITMGNKRTYRPLLQWIGGYLIARISPTIWYDEIFRRIDLHDYDKSLVVIGGIRYPEQAQLVQDNGGLVLAIERPAIEQQDTTDVTERNRSRIAADITLRNMGSLDALSVTIENLWNDVAAGNPAKTYISE